MPFRGYYFFLCLMPVFLLKNRQYHKASRSLLGAERAAGATGLDTTDDAELAIRRVRRIENELKNLKPTLKDEISKQKAEELMAKIQNFKHKVGLF